MDQDNDKDFIRKVDQELDRIGRTGERLGQLIKWLLVSIKKFAFFIGVILGFGVFVFIWSIGKGLKKK
jgi:hypothetical protein